MFTFAKPEQTGIKSENILRYIKSLENAELSTHNVIIAKGDKIIYENYYAPFHKDYLHRMYSVTKSFVAIAIGFLVQEGKVNLDDKIVDLFPADITGGVNENVKKQTVRNMLMMSTGFPLSTHGNWFGRRPKDRVRDYFSHTDGESKIPGSYFEYDSTGSFVLGALVEKISGMEFMDFLRDRLLDKIGVSKEAYCLKSPGGYAWTDSALLCKPSDLLKVAKFTMNMGSWQGEQILSADYLREATSNLISTHNQGLSSKYGYGYLIWRQQQDSFFFNGMGCQFAVCVPHKDMILIYNGDNQGIESSKAIIINNFYDMIVNEASDTALSPDDKAYEDLINYSKNLELMCCKGASESPVAHKINGKKFVADKNPMEIKDITFTFSEDGGIMSYTNAQGHKELPFAFGKNVFCAFPQSGYSDLCATERLDNHYYQCASSAQWLTETELYINVQIIDKYFGRLHMYFSFFDENTVSIRMNKIAEDFLDEYQGTAIAKIL